MPQTITIGAFVLGAVLLLLALSAGGFKIFGAEVSGSAGRTARVIAGVIGAALLVFTLFPLKIAGHPDDPTVTPTPSGTPLAVASSVPTPRVTDDIAPHVTPTKAAPPATDPLPVGRVTDGADSVQIVDIRPLPGTVFKRGTPQPFHLTLSYALASDDAAILSMSVAQISGTDGCGGGGQLTDASEVQIVRGRHDTSIDITWSGDTGAATGGHVDGRGYLSFVPMFWRSENGHRADRIRQFGGFQALCYRFGP